LGGTEHLAAVCEKAKFVWAKSIKGAGSRIGVPWADPRVRKQTQPGERC